MSLQPVDLHYQSLCDHSRNFALVNSTFWRICKKCLSNTDLKHWVSSFKHFLQILQNLPMQNSYCDHRNFDSVNHAGLKLLPQQVFSVVLAYHKQVRPAHVTPLPGSDIKQSDYTRSCSLKSISILHVQYKFYVHDANIKIWQTFSSFNFVNLKIVCRPLLKFCKETISLQLELQ